eukprot:scaffold239709_cov20-Prasinocladus_malaysianus.AAC.1
MELCELLWYVKSKYCCFVQGDTPDEAVRRFLGRREKPEGWTDENRLQLVDKVSDKAKDARLLPLMQLDLRAGDKSVPLYLFKTS